MLASELAMPQAYRPFGFGLSAFAFNREQHLLLADGSLTRLFALCGGFAGNAPLQGVHKVHNVPAAGPGSWTDGLALALRIDEFGQCLFVVILKSLRFEIGRLPADDMLCQIKHTQPEGTVGCSTAAASFTDAEVDDLARYLDVTRAEMLFARGIILVEGDAERYLVPAFAEKMDKPLDKLGITVCSVAGTNFVPYVKLLTALDIPFAVVTDWDAPGDEDEKRALGWNRTIKLALAIETRRC